MVNKIVYVGKHALTMTVSRHLHSNWELIFCTSGDGKMIFGDSTMPYSANDVVVIPPLLPHENVSTAGFTNIHINMEEATLNQTGPFKISADPNGFLQSAFSAAFYYYSGHSEGRSLLLPLYGQLIVATLAMQMPERLHSETVQELENDILKNYLDRSYDLNAFLNTLPFSAGYLKKLFKKETGLTPHQYLTDKRLENGASYLAANGGSQSISEIAHHCGFSDPLYFSRVFKRKYGVAPRDYTPEYAAPPDVSGSDQLKIML